jgi:uncharacterized protein YjiS (DUF1127 family)
MTAHVSKEQLGLMLPGTMSYGFRDEPEYLESPQPGLFASALAAISGWVSRDPALEDVSGLSDAQLSDIGISRGEANLAFDTGFAARRDHDRMLAALQTGRVAGI